jgi:integrase/recombinase XerC
MVDSFLKYLQYEKRFSPHTVSAYANDLSQLSDFLSSTFEITDLRDVRHPHLRGWVVHLMDNGNSPKSVNRRIATLKSFYKFMLRRESMEANPAGRLKPLKTAKELPNFVKEPEMNLMLDQLEFPQGFEGQRDKLVLEFLYATGIRLSELIGIKDGDINTYDKTVKVLGKRNKERIIPLHPELIRQLEEYKKQRNSFLGETTRLLVTDSGEQLYPVFVYRCVRSYLTQVTTLSKRSPHVLRHTFATHLLNKGADLNAVKDLLGHASLASTQVYTHNTIEKLKAVHDQAHPKA